MNTSSRTSLRLQLMREQSMIDQQKNLGGGSKESFASLSPGSSADATTASSSPLAIRLSTNTGIVGSSGSGGGGSVKTSPIIISQPIRFTGNRLVHLPPQIIHVQQQQIAGDDIMGRRNLILSSSLPPGLPQNTPPKVAISTKTQRVVTPQHYQIGQHQTRQHRSSVLSKQSPSELSPSGPGNCESPSASFTSAQSELDDIIIDEILSMEEEQRRLDPEMTRDGRMPNSVSYANNLEGYLTSGRASYGRQVSSSAPTSTIDIEGLVRDELTEEHDIVRDRRKKDIHNMIERRRRYNINDRIKELGTLLPKGCTEEMKLNKGTILKASVEYIRALRRDQEKMHQILLRYQNIEQENKALVTRIQDLEDQLRTHGVPVPPADRAAFSFGSSRNDVDASASSRHAQNYYHRPIKVEPLEEEPTPQPTPQPMPNDLAPSFLPGSTLAESKKADDSIAPMCQQNSHAQLEAQDCRGHVQQQQTRTDYNPAMVGGHSYAISDAQFSSFYSSTVSPYGDSTAMGDVLETPPVVNNNLSPFGQPRLVGGPASHRPVYEDISKAQRQHQQLQDLMMDLGADVGGSALSGGHPSAAAALVSSADPLMSDTRLINSQVASPEVQWESQAFSPENDQMDFAAQ